MEQFNLSLILLTIIVATTTILITPIKFIVSYSLELIKCVNLICLLATISIYIPIPILFLHSSTFSIVIVADQVITISECQYFHICLDKPDLFIFNYFVQYFEF